MRSGRIDRPRSQASRVLTGKYRRADIDHGGDSADAVRTRKKVAPANNARSERGHAIAEVVKEIAGEFGRAPAQVALAWTLLNPAVTAAIIGARTLDQLEVNLGALDVTLSDEQRARLADASAVELGFPHDFLAGPTTRGVMFGHVKIAPQR